MDYLHLFDSDSEYNNYLLNDYDEPFVSSTFIESGETEDIFRVNYNLSEEE